MKRKTLLKLLESEKLTAIIGITGEYCINNTDTGKVVFKGHHEHFLRELGLKYIIDYRM